MTIELRTFDQIIKPPVEVIAEPRSFDRMNERLSIYDAIQCERMAAGSTEGFDELNRRSRLDALQRRRDALTVEPGQLVRYIEKDTIAP